MCTRGDHGNGIPNENGNKTPIWEWKRVGMNVGENENDPCSHEK